MHLSAFESLKPGDRVCIKGIVQTDSITYTAGDIKTLHYITLTDTPVITKKAPRVSTTVFEQREAKRNQPRGLPPSGETRR